jgi:hypothetical protein
MGLPFPIRTKAAEMHRIPEALDGAILGHCPLRLERGYANALKSKVFDLFA